MYSIRCFEVCKSLLWTNIFYLPVHNKGGGNPSPRSLLLRIQRLLLEPHQGFPPALVQQLQQLNFDRYQSLFGANAQAPFRITPTPEEQVEVAAVEPLAVSNRKRARGWDRGSSFFSSSTD
jgi:hypothetical protein